MKLLCAALITVSLYGADKPVVMHWDTAALTLSWVNSKDHKTKHVIDFKTRTMDANGKKALRFSEQERQKVLRILIGLLHYAVDSEDWHADGGDKATPDTTPANTTPVLLKAGPNERGRQH